MHFSTSTCATWRRCVQELAAKKGDTLRKIDIAAMDEKRTARILKTMGAASSGMNTTGRLQ